MPKRGRSNSASLTGGTGDVNPQYFVVNVPAGTVNDSVNNVAVPLPVPKFPGNNNKAVVMEILSVDWSLSTVNMAQIVPVAPGAPAIQDNFLFIATSDLATQTYAQATLSTKVVSYVHRSLQRQLDATVTGSFDDVFQLKEEDLISDAAGHGMLVATDNIWLGGVFFETNNITASSPGIPSCVARIFYRFKEIGLAEYIGIVQSQQ